MTADACLSFPLKSYYGDNTYRCYCLTGVPISRYTVDLENRTCTLYIDMCVGILVLILSLTNAILVVDGLIQKFYMASSKI